jgi:copper chaperone
MGVSLAVENIKCGGCANGIKQKLATIEGVKNVQVDIEAGLVSCELNESSDNDSILNSIKQQLATMGYPEVGSVEGLKAAGAKAKSYVSCAVGKMTDSSS